MKNQLLLLFFLCAVSSSLVQAQEIDRKYYPTHTFDSTRTPQAPVYSDEKNWVALPWRTDEADRLPADLVDLQQTAEADVFFIYPTFYLGDYPNQVEWNASTQDTFLNREIVTKSIQYQASVFAGAGRIFSPIYRQAHLNAFFTKDKKTGEAALELAYTDIKRAFEYYLEHYNNGRPIIIAGHSQGSWMAGHLLKEFFDGKPLASQLVAAYVPGMIYPVDFFQTLKSCEGEGDTGCICTWRTVRGDWKPRYALNEKVKTMEINPICWKTDNSEAPRHYNKALVMPGFKKIKNPCTATLKGNFLSIKLKPILRLFVRRKDFHAADINMFYYSIYENARLRSSIFADKSNISQH